MPNPDLKDQAQIPQQIEADSGAAYSHHLAGHLPLPTKRRRIDQFAQLPVNQAFGADPPRSCTASIIEGVLGSALLPAPLAGTASALPHESQSAASTLQPPGLLDDEFFTLMGPPGESSMMSQPGFGIGCSSACIKLPLRSASDDEAFVRRNREVAVCVMAFTGLVQTQYFPDGVRKYVNTLVWLLVGIAYLSRRTRNRLLSSLAHIHAFLTPLPPIFAFFVALSLPSAESKHSFLEWPDHQMFRAFAHGVCHAVLCGELWLQIASTVMMDVGLLATSWYRWEISSHVGSLNSSGLFLEESAAHAMWRCVAVLVVQWLGLLGTNLLIWKGLRPFSRSLDRPSLPRVQKQLCI